MINLKSVIQTYPESLENKQRLSAFLNDLYPNEQQLIHILVLIYDCGMADELEDMDSIDILGVTKYIHRLERQFGIQEHLAYDALHQWLDALSVTYDKANNPTDIHKNQNQTGSQYAHYLLMLAVDQDISDCAGYLEDRKQFKLYIEHCKKQLQNISYCIQCDWTVPPLENSNPDMLIQKAKSGIAYKDQMKKIKIGLALTGVVMVAVALLVFWVIGKSREGKIEIPFNAHYAISKDYLEIQEELVDAGFTDITLIESDTGWLKDGEVLSITIDNSDTYNKGTYKEPDVTIVITYGSANRIDVSALLADWQRLSFSDIEARLRNAGFTNITTSAKTTHSAQESKMLDSITLNGDVYTNGHAFLPSDAPIHLIYWSLKIFVSDTNTSFLGRNYESVVTSLKEDGFINIQTEEIKTGWAPDNSVISVSINNQTNYVAGDEFAPEAKIVVKYSSSGRVDITSVMFSWSSQESATLEKTLRAAGFNNLSFKTTATSKSEQNHQVAAVKINGETYVGGECHVQKTAPIEITMYVLQLAIGRSADDIEDEHYTDIVAWLKGLGFTNITLKRTNDLITGWINPEGSIKSITINGNGNFDENAHFDYNSEIVIIVYTFKNKGCTDITIAA